MIIEQLSNQLLTVQVLLESVINELIETNIIDKDSLDARIKHNISLIEESASELENVLKDLKKEKESEVLFNIFKGPHGEA